MREDVDTKLLHHALPEQRSKDRLAIRAEEREHERERHPSGGSRRHPDVARRDRDVDHVLREHRTYELEQSFQHQQSERARDERKVRPRVHQETAHQPAIVRAPQHFFFVKRALRRHQRMLAAANATEKQSAPLACCGHNLVWPLPPGLWTADPELEVYPICRFLRGWFLD